MAQLKRLPYISEGDLYTFPVNSGLVAAGSCSRTLLNTDCPVRKEPEVTILIVSGLDG